MDPEAKKNVTFNQYDGIGMSFWFFLIQHREKCWHVILGMGQCRINGKHWCTRQEYPLNKEGESLFPNNSWTGSLLLTHIGPYNRLSTSNKHAFSFNMGTLYKGWLFRFLTLLVTFFCCIYCIICLSFFLFFFGYNVYRFIYIM